MPMLISRAETAAELAKALKAQAEGLRTTEELVRNALMQAKNGFRDDGADALSAAVGMVENQAQALSVDDYVRRVNGMVESLERITGLSYVTPPAPKGR